jgi:hypothetical protein
MREVKHPLGQKNYLKIFKDKKKYENVKKKLKKSIKTSKKIKL